MEGKRETEKLKEFWFGLLLKHNKMSGKNEPEQKPKQAGKTCKCFVRLFHESHMQTKLIEVVLVCQNVTLYDYRGLHCSFYLCLLVGCSFCFTPCFSSPMCFFSCFEFHDSWSWLVSNNFNLCILFNMSRLDLEKTLIFFITKSNGF